MDNNQPDTPPAGNSVPDPSRSEIPPRPIPRSEFTTPNSRSTQPLMRRGPTMDGMVSQAPQPPRPSHSPQPQPHPIDGVTAPLTPVYNRPISNPNPIPPQPITPQPAQPAYQQPLSSQPIPQTQPQTVPGAQTTPQPPQVLSPVSDEQAAQDQTAAQPTPQKAKKRKKLRLRTVLKVFTIIVVVAGAGELFTWYMGHYHSVYNKLAVATYNQNGVGFQFQYPAVMKSAPTLAGQLQFTPVAYTYQATKDQIALVDVNFTALDKTVKQLGLTPGQMLTQVKNDSGSYIDYLNQSNLGYYSDTYKNCTNYVPTPSGNALSCTIRGSAVTIARVISFTPNYQYMLVMSMPNDVWNAHQNVWQQVEKSFNTPQ